MKHLTLATILAISTMLVGLAACGEAETKPGNVSPNGETNIAPNIAPNVGSNSATLVLNNDTDSTIYIDGNCDATWYQLRDSNGDIVRPSLGCAFCECGVESCAVCGACPAAEPVAVAPGESLEWTWQGIYWASSSDEFRDSCQEQRQYEPGGTFTAEFCYGFQAAEFEIPDFACRSETFQYGTDAQVVHVPEAPSVDPVCESADSNGFFDNCDACGDDCDEIDAPNATGFACGCAGGCPCGFSCGSYEIGPGVVVDNICVK